MTRDSQLIANVWKEHRNRCDERKMLESRFESILKGFQEEKQLLDDELTTYKAVRLRFQYSDIELL